MAKFYSLIKAAIQAAADAAGGLYKISLGTPTSPPSYVQYPAAGQVGSKSWEVGVAWDGVGVPGFLQPLCNFIDNFYPVWAHFSTSLTSVAPVINADYGVASVSKDEGNDQVTITFDDAFASAYYFVSSHIVGARSFGIEVAGSMLVGSITFEYHNDAGVKYTINSRDVVFIAVGKI